METVGWRAITNAVKQGKCGLFLGPGILRVRDGNAIVPFRQLLTKELADVLQRDAGCVIDTLYINQFNYVAQQFCAMPLMMEGDLATIAKSLFQELKIKTAIQDGIYKELGQLFFPVVINMNPDDLLLQAIGAGQCISLSGRRQNLDLHGMQDRSVIFNMSGSFDNTWSLLFTKTQLEKYLSDLEKRYWRLKDYIMSRLQCCSCFLFLGFDYEDGYLDTLLTTFSVCQPDKLQIAVQAFPVKAGTPCSDYFRNKFRLMFVDMDPEYFIKKLLATLNLN